MDSHGSFSAHERPTAVGDRLVQRRSVRLRSHRATVEAYATALGLALIAAALQWALYPWVESRVVFLFFGPMLMLAAARGGMGPGLLVLLLGVLSGVLAVPPAGSMGVAALPDQLTLLAFCLTGGVLVVYASRSRFTSQRAHEAEERLRLVQQNTGIGLFDLDFEHNTAYATSALCDLVGRPRMDGRMPLDQWLASLPSSNVDETLQVLTHKREQGIDRYEREQSFLLPDGRTRWLLSRVVLEVDAAGQTLRARGATIDISDRKRLDLQLQQVRAELEQQVDDLRQLHELSTRLLEPAALSQHLHIILQSLARLQGAAGATMSVQSAATGELHVAAWHGFDEATRARMVTVPAGLDPRRAALHGGSLVVDDLASDERWAPLHQALLPMSIRALHCTPLASLSGEAVGVITLYLPDARAPSARELQLAEICARKAAVFIERSRAQEQLQEADRRKDEFLATLAHELRNPLAPIRQAALISRSPAAGEVQRRWSHDVIDRQVQHMAMLLDDLLDVSRITRGTLQLRRRSVSLSSVLDAAIETARPAIDAMHHQLQVTLPVDSALLNADSLRLAQVISNVLLNAAKYTEPGGVIRLTARWLEADAAACEGPGDGPGGRTPTDLRPPPLPMVDEPPDVPAGKTRLLRIEVSDNGIGIRPEALGEIFEMFTQARAGKDRSGGGLGIGLALAKGLVAMHGGRISAHSDGPGQGTRVCIDLPARLEITEPERVPLPPIATAAPPARRVLIADDNRDAADSLGMLLQLAGHTVEVVYDGQAAWDAFCRDRPDVAVLDLGMPGLRGEAVAGQIRAAGAQATTLIAVTGWGHENDKRRSRGAGFDHHLTKPIDPQQLHALIHGLPAS